MAGKTIFVHAEQGLGDTLQFCRYAPLLAELGAAVVLGVQAALAPLLRQSLPNIQQVVAQGEALPAFEFHCPLMSLPLALWNTHKTIPAPVHYLQAAPHQMAAWDARLPAKAKRRVGLVWSGRAAFANERNRRIPLQSLIPLVQELGEDISFVSLQKEIQDDDAAVLDAHPNICTLGKSLGDFADTAALCANLDLIISVDTSLAHLSGALGRPTWVLLSYVPDWRWMLHRADSPWYPSARLFRQTQPGNWANVISEVRAALQALDFAEH